MPPKKSGPKNLLPDDSPAKKVVQAARRQFFAHGFRSVSMDDLAAELGMSKKTLYAHFPSKGKLVRAVLLAKAQEVETELAQLSHPHGSPVESALHDLLACLQRHTSEIQPAFVRDIGRDTPELFHLIEQRRRELISRHFGALFDQGRKSGTIRRDIPTHLIIEILLGAVHSIMNPSKLNALGLTVETGYSSIIRVILEGALTHNARSSP
jgi:AcrR family transcriptional regulator